MPTTPARPTSSGSASRGSARSTSCPSPSNKVTRQAAIIADLEPAAAQKLCADYQARKLFCQVKKPEEFVPPFGGFWR